MPEEPTYDPALGEEKFKSSKQLVSIRGVEEIHTELIHRQYGLAAIGGGFISAYDFNFIRVIIIFLVIYWVYELDLFISYFYKRNKF